MDDEIRKRDLQVFRKEFFTPTRLIVVVLASAVLSGWAQNFFVFLLALAMVASVNGIHAWYASFRSRFYDTHFADLWDGCVERHNRFTQVFERGKRNELSGLSEMPRTIDGVKGTIYRALRKADIVAHELHESEGELAALPRLKQDVTRDHQSQELLQVADRNVVEYRQGLANLMAGVQRTEAQAAVFMTTIDTLRLRMLGHRLAGRSPEMGSHEFLAAMAEAKLQLQSIDKALDELDLGLYPQRVAPPSPFAPGSNSQSVSGVRPPPPPTGVVVSPAPSGAAGVDPFSTEATNEISGLTGLQNPVNPTLEGGEQVRHIGQQDSNP